MCFAFKVLHFSGRRGKVGIGTEIVNLTSAIAAFNAISGTRKENTSTVETVLGKLVKTGAVFANVWEGF